MKTPPIDHPTPTGKKTAKRTVAKGSGFQHLLETTLKANAAANSPVHPNAPALVPGTPGLEAVEKQPSAAGGFERMDRFLAALSAYQKGLEQPSRRLRDLATAFERLESEHRHLAHWAETARLDEDFQSIVNEGLVTATLEIHRFRSGQYCS